MKVDSFDQHVLKQKGDASDILNELYGWEIGKNNGEKQLAGIRKHIRHKLKMQMNGKEYPDISEMEEIYVKGDGSVTTKRMMYLSEEDVKDPARVMFLMGYDPGEWELVSCKTRRNYWDVTMKISEGNARDGFNQWPEKRTNHAYVCEIVTKPRKDGIKSATIEKIFNSLEAPELVEYTYDNRDSGLMLELPVMDFHIGKLAWGDETGDSNWNIKKAEKIYKAAITDMLLKIYQYGIDIERIVFPIGQDYFHFDTSDNKTTGGTPMDTDSRWEKMFNTGVELLVWAIENLRKIAPVEVFWIPGNHDTMLSYFATHSVAAWFRNIESVNVDLSPIPRKYVRHGLCLIGFAHGQDERTRIGHLMQIEARNDWGKTKYNEMHLGHIHKEEVKEEGGVIVRNIGSITAIDSWHKKHGFVGATRKMTGMIWHKDNGKTLTIDVNVTMR